jgi:hypothetical protein
VLSSFWIALYFVNKYLKHSLLIVSFEGLDFVTYCHTNLWCHFVYLFVVEVPRNGSRRSHNTQNNIEFNEDYNLYAVLVSVIQWSGTQTYAVRHEGSERRTPFFGELILNGVSILPVPRRSILLFMSPLTIVMVRQPFVFHRLIQTWRYCTHSYLVSSVADLGASLGMGAPVVCFHDSSSAR